MSIIVPSNHTRIRAWVNSKMSGRNPDVSSCQSLLSRSYGIKVVVARAADLCFHLHCGNTPGGGSHRVLLRSISWWNYRAVGDKVDWSEGRSFPYLYRS